MNQIKPVVAVLESRRLMTGLDFKVTTYDFGGQGSLTANLMTGDVAAEVNIGAGIILDTSELKSLSLPRIDFADALGTLVGSTATTTDPFYQPGGQRDTILKQNPGAYVASERFADYMSPATLASEVAVGIALGGASASGAVGRLTDILHSELDDILAWGQRTGASQLLTPDFFTRLVASVATGKNFDTPNFSIEWYADKVTTTMRGGLLDGVGATLPHLSFAIIPKGALATTSVAGLLASFDASRSSGLSSGAAGLVGSTVASLLGGGFKLSDLDAVLGGLKTTLGGISAQQLQGAVAAANGSPVIDLKNALPDVITQLNSALEFLALGNAHTASVDRMTLDLTTMEVRLDFTLESKQVWDVGNELPPWVKQGYATVAAKFNQAEQWADAELDKAKQKAEQLAQAAIDEYNAAVAAASAQLNLALNALNSFLASHKRQAQSYWNSFKQFFVSSRPTTRFVNSGQQEPSEDELRDSVQQAQKTYNGLVNQQTQTMAAITATKNQMIAQAQAAHDVAVQQATRTATISASGGATADSGTATLAPPGLGGDAISVGVTGRIYDLNHQGELWTTLADASGNIQAWTRVLTGVASFARPGSGDLVYILTTGGQLDVMPAGTGVKPVYLWSEVKDFRVRDDGTLFFLQFDGELLRAAHVGLNGMSGAHAIHQNVSSFDMNPDGTLFALAGSSFEQGTGFVASDTGQWTSLFTGVTQAADGSLYRTNGSVLLRGWGNSWTVVMSDVAVLLPTRDATGAVDIVTQGGDYDQLDPMQGSGTTSWHTQMTNVDVSDFGGINRLAANGDLWSLTAGEWSRIADHVTSYAAVASTYVLRDDHTLSKLQAGGDQLIADHVVSFSNTGIYDIYDYLKDDGTYWTRNKSGSWTQNQAGVQEDSAGNLYSLDASGTLRRRIVQMNYSQVPPDIFVGWARITDHVRAFAMGPNDQIATLQEDGTLSLLQVVNFNQKTQAVSLSGGPIRPNVADVVNDSRGNLYALDHDGTVALDQGGVWQALGSGYTAITINNDKLSALKADGLNLYVYDPTQGWQVIPLPQPAPTGTSGGQTGIPGGVTPIPGIVTTPSQSPAGGAPTSGGPASNGPASNGQGGNSGGQTSGGQGSDDPKGGDQNGGDSSHSATPQIVVPPAITPTPTPVPTVLAARAVRNRHKSVTAVSVIMNEPIDSSGLGNSAGFLLLAPGKKKHAKPMPVRVQSVSADPVANTITITLMKATKARSLWLAINAGSVRDRQATAMQAVPPLAVS